MGKLRALPVAARIPLLAYRILFPVVFLAMLPGYIARMIRRGNYGHQFGQRFGFFSANAGQRLAPGGWTWIHAVSVGEAMMGLKLARVLQEESPGLRVLISTTTSTGFAVIREQIAQKGDGLELIYFPLDMAFIVRRVLRLVRPARLVLVDKELWPNMVVECYRRSIPVSIVNARLSPRSERGFLRWRRWVGPFFGMLEGVCVQEPEDVERWQRFGVRREALRCTGSLKFDFAAASQSRAPEFRALLRQIGVFCDGDRGDGEGTPILLGGSTFPGEEAILGRVLLQLREQTPDLFLIIAPRHVERTPEVEADLRQLGLRPLLRTSLSPGADGPAVPRPDVLIINTTGELRHWYGVATVCFVGKSLAGTAIGGQNPVEPVLAGRPVIFGPHMENFGALVRQLLDSQGALQVPDETGLAESVRLLLDDPARRATLVDRARGLLRPHEGANRRTAGFLLGLPG